MSIQGAQSIMLGKRLLQVTLVAIVATQASPSNATSELHKNAALGLVGEIIIGASNLNSDWHFEILGTDPAAMSAVISVFSYPDRAFLGQGVSDYEPGTGAFAAAVDVPHGGTTGKMYVIVRPNGTAQSNVLLRATRLLNVPPYSQSSSDFALSFSGQGVGGSGRVLIPGGLAANTQVWTTEEAETSWQVEGKNDTILMVLEDDIPIAFDDDSGVARMSWLQLNSPCRPQPAHTCEILIASRMNDKHRQDPSQPGYEVPLPIVSGFHATLGWDEDAGNGLDTDGDQLGNALEDYIGTDKTKWDSDGDGIPDGAEVRGVDDEGEQEVKTSLVRLPYYGANPVNQKDVFVELDWLPSCSGPTCAPGSKDNYRFTYQRVKQLAGIFPPDIRFHVDSGYHDPSYAEVTGDWGGSERIPEGAPDQGHCTGFSPNRHYFSHWLATGGIVQNGGRCSSITSGDLSAAAHEMGHYFGLMHYGHPDSTPINCKYNYLSVMNYAFQGYANPTGSGVTWFGQGANQIPAFSRNNLGFGVLNPFLINEPSGAGAAINPAVLDFYEQELQMVVDRTTGAVDWNRNNVIDQVPVKGMLNIPTGSGGDCDPSAPNARCDWRFRRVGLPSLSADSGSLEVTALTPATPLSPTVGVLVGLQPTSLTDCTTRQGFTDPCVTWPTSGGTVVYPAPPVPQPGLFSPAAAGGIVVYADASGNMYFFDKAAAISASASGTNVAITRVGGPPIDPDGDPIAIVRPSGIVSVYAPSGGFLLRWDFDPSQGVWTVIGDTQFWANTNPRAPVLANAGIGLTWGYQRSFPGETQFPGQNLYAAILTQDSGGNATIALARLNGGETQTTPPGTTTPIFALSSDWVELPSSTTGLTGPMGSLVRSRVGLAFRPEDPTSAPPQAGRFYVTFQQQRQDGCFIVYENLPYTTFTKGNLYSDITPLGAPGQDGPLVFNNATMVANEWTSYSTGASIVYFDGNVRGIMQIDPMPVVPVTIQMVNGQAVCSVPSVLAPFKSMSGPTSTFYPNIDGIFNMDEADFDDVSFIKTNMSQAVAQ
jgi:hypothetical protein